MRRVLIVDDNEDMRFVARMIFNATPMEVVGEARDGSEALSLADELRPDLVLMDVLMPGLDGVEATRRLKQRLPETTVVGFTAWTSPTTDNMLEAGASAVFSKEHIDDLMVHLRKWAAGEPTLA